MQCAEKGGAEGSHLHGLAVQRADPRGRLGVFFKTDDILGMFRIATRAAGQTCCFRHIAWVTKTSEGKRGGGGQFKGL